MLTFEPSSVKGILLFREVSKLMVTYGRATLAAPAPKEHEAYARRYKGIWMALATLMRSLSGNYVNFGVFELYGDTALKDALGMAIQLSLTVPLEEIMTYRKMAKAYFALLEVLCHGHLAVIRVRATRPPLRISCALSGWSAVAGREHIQPVRRRDR